MVDRLFDTFRRATPPARKAKAEAAHEQGVVEELQREIERRLQIYDDEIRIMRRGRQHRETH
jgi:hypothetical protein